MPVQQPRPGDLSPIDTASRDEITALQLQRMQATLQRAYANVPHYRQAFDAHGVHPDDLQQLSDLAKFPFTVKTPSRRTCARTIRSACSRYRASRWRASTPPRAPPASRPWWATRRTTSTPGPNWWRARSAPRAAGRAT